MDQNSLRWGRQRRNSNNGSAENPYLFGKNPKNVDENIFRPGKPDLRLLTSVGA